MERPKLQLTLSPLDKMVMILGWIALVALWWLTISHYRSLPEVIPTHYNAMGKIDAYGSKRTVFILPAIGTILFVVIAILNRFPQVFNYPTEITADNALRQYTNATRLLRLLQLMLMLVFLFIQFKTMKATVDGASGLGVWFLPTVLVFIFVPVAYFVVRSFKAK
ncbi:DUF1648 domain-containing protein [Pedobacter sp. KR3-3]|uniref:DUF1648 domain-containing protein n=1 Tax=Pedobacter albus TaxID=3113905 RepID=A0ABU7I8X6_9SPHI|nr:DUF1648 domain-containing protein [Pedobacter sp. KR3-3]MEE1945932.1 DUF1648 domain-containing protein [Pedobacter sp. KR3-3]